MGKASKASKGAKASKAASDPRVPSRKGKGMPKGTAKGEGKAAPQLGAVTAHQELSQVPVTLSRVLLVHTPAGWGAQDVESLCQEYGKVDAVMPANHGNYEVTFQTAEMAEGAMLAFQTREVQTDTGASLVKCEMIDDSDLGLGFGSGSSGTVQQPRAMPEDRGQPTCIVFVDELHSTSGGPGPADREVFMKNLPVGDYTEKQLQEWLDVYGTVEDLLFLRDDQDSLSGSCYVRFATPEEAAGLLVSIPPDSTGTALAGSWSVSERMLQGTAKPTCDALRSSIARAQMSLRTSCECRAVALHGDQADGDRLHFALWRDAPPNEVAMATIRAELSAVLIAASQDASGTSKGAGKPGGKAASLARGKDGEASHKVCSTSVLTSSWQAEASDSGRRAEASSPENERSTQDLTPCVFLEGFPVYWEKPQVMELVKRFGVVTAVHFVEAPGGRAARVELKNTGRLGLAAEQLNGREVDGYVLSAQLQGAKPAKGSGKRDGKSKSAKPPAAPTAQDPASSGPPRLGSNGKGKGFQKSSKMAPASEESVPDSSAAPVKGKGGTAAPAKAAKPIRTAHVELEEDLEDDAFDAEDGSIRPCILVEGFPDTWQREHVADLVKRYGAVAAVHFVEDPLGRAARVELRDARRLGLAAKQLSGKEVEDGHVLSVQLYGAG
jgi:hypothetical protein